MPSIPNQAPNVNTSQVDIVRDGANFERERVQTSRKRVDSARPHFQNVRERREYAQSELKRLGLVGVDISSQTHPTAAVLRVSPGGMTCKRKNYGSSLVGARRGVVCGMSSKSAKRLRGRLIELDMRTLKRRGFFVTLTYPGEWSENWRDWKRDLKVMLTRLQRAFKVEGILWKLEYQERGAPHFHLLTVFERELTGPQLWRLRKWLSLAWFKVVGSGDAKHLKAGTGCVKLYGTTESLMTYVSKYMTKELTGPARHSGRCWGQWGEMPTGQSVEIPLNELQFIELMRRVRRWGKRSRYVSRLTVSHKGWLAFGSSDRTIQLLRGLWGDEWGINYAHQS